MISNPGGSYPHPTDTNAPRPSRGGVTPAGRSRETQGVPASRRLPGRRELLVFAPGSTQGVGDHIAQLMAAAVVRAL